MFSVYIKDNYELEADAKYKVLLLKIKIQPICGRFVSLLCILRV